MTFDLVEYWKGVASKAGLSDEQVTAISTQLGDEAVAKAMGSAFVPRPEVDRSLDKIKTETRETAMKEAKTGYDQWYYNEALPTLKTLQDQVTAYETQHGPLKEGDIAPPITPKPGEDPPISNANAGIAKQVMEQVQILLKDRDAATVNLWQDGLVIVDSWQRQFPGEDLPAQEIRKFAEENNLRPIDAFEKFIAPRITEKQETQHKTELETARAEGAKDALSKLDLPIDSAPKEPAPFFTKAVVDDDGKPKGPMTDAEKSAIFTEGWKEAVPQ